MSFSLNCFKGGDIGDYIGFILGLYGGYMGDNGKENGNYYNGLYGWLSKLWSLFGYPTYWVPDNRDSKKEDNFDNHPYRGFYRA